MKFLNRQKFLDTVNQWVRDGSNIVSIDSNPVGEVAILKGRDGVTEILAFFYEESDYDESELESPDGDVLDSIETNWADDKPMKDSSEDNVTPAQKLVGDMLDDIQKTRIRLLDELMSNPGFLATFGKDFVVQFEDVEMRMNEGDRSLYDPLRELRLDVRHKITVSEAVPRMVKDDLKAHSLRQDLEGNLESV